MTTISLSHSRGFNPLPLFLIGIIMLLVSVVIPQVIESQHAALHEEASMIRQCFMDGKINQVWINSSLERLNCLVDLPDGTVGDRVLQWSCKRLAWIEITAYQLGDGTLGDAVRILKAKGCMRVDQ